MPNSSDRYSQPPSDFDARMRKRGWRPSSEENDAVDPWKVFQDSVEAWANKYPKLIRHPSHFAHEVTRYAKDDLVGEE